MVEKKINEISKQAQEIEDMIDYLKSEVSFSKQLIKNKEEVISKLLKFTPEEKKSSIL